MPAHVAVSSAIVASSISDAAASGDVECEWADLKWCGRFVTIRL